MIVVEDFHKAYDRTVAACELSFRVGAGEILGLVGPNGSGKTTTLRALAGVLPPSQGRLEVSGFDVVRRPLDAKKHTAYVQDDPQLFHDLTIDQHLAFFASAYHIADAEDKSTALLRRFELEGKRRAAASELSRGMRQKLAICCAYLHDPRAILLDEPLTGLDPRGIRVLKDSIVERAESGSAVIISSHLLAMVEDVCTHVMVLAHGHQQFCGPLSELVATYASEEAGSSLEDIFFRATSGAEIGHPASASR